MYIYIYIRVYQNISESPRKTQQVCARPCAALVTAGAVTFELIQPLFEGDVDQFISNYT